MQANYWHFLDLFFYNFRTKIKDGKEEVFKLKRKRLRYIMVNIV